jgi:Ca2+:H+ antiporter
MLSMRCAAHCTAHCAARRSAPSRLPPQRPTPPPLALGNSPQIAIFAIPLAVIVGWVIGRPFSLDLDPFAVVALTVGVVHANFVTSGAQSHWLMGLQLIATYLLIAVTFLYR